MHVRCAAPCSSPFTPTPFKSHIQAHTSDAGGKKNRADAYLDMSVHAASRLYTQKCSHKSLTTTSVATKATKV